MRVWFGLIFFSFANMIFASENVFTTDDNCDCAVINCINVSEKLNSNRSYNIQAMKLKLNGTLSSKEINHPSKGKLITPTIILEPKTCLHGSFYKNDDSGEYEKLISRVMSEVQLSYPNNNLMNFHKSNKLKQVTLSGYVTLTSNANHSTPPFLFMVIDE